MSRMIGKMNEYLQRIRESGYMTLVGLVVAIIHLLVATGHFWLELTRHGK